MKDRATPRTSRGIVAVGPIHCPERTYNSTDRNTRFGAFRGLIVDWQAVHDEGEV